MDKILHCFNMQGSDGSEDITPEKVCRNIISTDGLKPHGYDGTIVHIFGEIGSQKNLSVSHHSGLNRADSKLVETEENCQLSDNQINYNHIHLKLSDVRISKVSIGRDHMCLLSDRGDVYSFGHGLKGQLGLTDGCLKSLKIQKIPFLKNIVDIACGNLHSLAVNKNGKIFFWGDGRFLEESINCVYIPFEVKNFEKLDIKVEVVESKFNRILLGCSKNNVYLWGEHFDGQFFSTPVLMHQMGRENTIKNIAIGKMFYIVLTKSYYAFVWGDSTYGESLRKIRNDGTGLFQKSTELNEKNNLIDFRDLTGKRINKFLKVACGSRHALLLSTDNRVFSIGDNIHGQCGLDNAITRCEIPNAITLNDIQGHEIQDIACGSRHSACLANGRLIYLWGDSSHHKLIHTISEKIITPGLMKPGVAINSVVRDSCCQPLLAPSFLSCIVECISLGDEATVVVTTG